MIEGYPTKALFPSRIRIQSIAAKFMSYLVSNSNSVINEVKFAVTLTILHTWRDGHIEKSLHVQHINTLVTLTIEL